MNAMPQAVQRPDECAIRRGMAVAPGRGDRQAKNGNFHASTVLKARDKVRFGEMLPRPELLPRNSVSRSERWVYTAWGYTVKIKPWLTTIHLIQACRYRHWRHNPRRRKRKLMFPAIAPIADQRCANPAARWFARPVASF